MASVWNPLGPITKYQSKPTKHLEENLQNQKCRIAGVTLLTVNNARMKQITLQICLLIMPR